MTLGKVWNEKTLIISIQGRIDTTTAPELEAQIKEILNEVEILILDFSDVEYISSAGLRVLLSTQKIMNRQGKMTVRHINEVVQEVFEVTGFVNILAIED